MQNALTISQAPWLKTLSSTAWEKFAADYDSYVARGGDIQMRTLLSTSVIGILKIRLKKQMGDEGLTFEELDLRKAIEQLFAPRSSMDSLERLQRVGGMAKGGSAVPGLKVSRDLICL